jgi:uncharacterized protein YjeT (DUF2065 family)
MGRIAGLDHSKPRAESVRLLVSFSTPDGQRVEFREPIRLLGRVDEPVRVRYNPRNPESATICPPLRLVAETSLAAMICIVSGLSALAGSLLWLTNGDERLFYGLAGFGFFSAIGFIGLYVGVTAYGKARSWRRMVSAVGTVRRVQPRTFGDKNYPHPWISYTTDGGQKVEFWDTQLTGYAPGKEVTIFYDPEYPEFTSTGVDKGGYAGQAALLGIFGVLSISAGVGLLWAQFVQAQ